MIMLQRIASFFAPHRLVETEPAPPVPLPPPPGWAIVPCHTPGVVGYQVTRQFRFESQAPYGPGMELGGANATEFHGFPRATLVLSHVPEIQAIVGERGVDGMRITYRFDYRPEGWGAYPIPLMDFARLPWGTD